MTRPLRLFASLVLACAVGVGAPASMAQPAASIDVTNAWVRATVPGQGGTGAFMTLLSHTGGKLVGVSTPVAGVAEVHEMKMEGNTMKMRAVPSIELPAHTSVELRPGGYHLMLMDLKQALPNGTRVPVTLQFEDAKGARSSVDVSVPVRTAAGVPAPAKEHKH